LGEKTSAPPIRQRKKQGRKGKKIIKYKKKKGAPMTLLFSQGITGEEKVVPGGNPSDGGGPGGNAPEPGS